MFYENDLRSAVDEAVRESKLVACFVTDNGEESQLWENDFLSDFRIKDILSEKTVLLRLEAGSKEAGYLAAIFPLPKSPTFVVIQDGQLKEYLTSGVPREDFMKRLLSVFNAVDTHRPVSSHSQNLSEVSSQAQTRARLPTQISIGSETTSRPNLDVKASNTEKDATSDPNSEKPILQPGSINPRYAIIQKKREEDECERARILKRVEEDNRRRRYEAARRKEERERSSCTLLSCNSTPVSAISQTSRNYSGDTSSLLIRLFDGSAIRNKFPITATLADDVRTFISQHQPEISNQPYIFKHVLSPLPNHTFGTTEENQSLQDLGCVPSATLILAPIKTYTEAYSNTRVGSTATGLIGGVINSGWGVVSGGIGMVTGAIGAVMGSGAIHDRCEISQRAESCDKSTLKKASPPRKIPTMRTIEKASHSDKQQFYNGNSVNFEPRPKDDEGEKNE